MTRPVPRRARPTLALRVLTSAERTTQRVEQVYWAELGRGPSDRERVWWVSSLTRRSLSPARMAELISETPEFAARSLRGA